MHTNGIEIHLYLALNFEMLMLMCRETNDSLEMMAKHGTVATIVLVLHAPILTIYSAK